MNQPAWRPRLDATRLRAPAGDGELLIEPPWSATGELLEGNRARQQAWRYDVQGRSLESLMAAAREEVVRAAHEYTSSYCDVPSIGQPQAVLLAGHQPELFHPGVWFKNFALARLAREQDAVAINLIIDSDTVKQASLMVPAGTLSEPRVETVEFDAPGAQIPYEERMILNRDLLASFGDRAMQAMRNFVAQPLLKDFWPLVVERAGATPNLGECMAQARRQLEGAWGVQSLELPQSRVCSLESFDWFAAHLFAQADRFREVYNGAVDEYRRVNRVRSVNHPAPNLAVHDEWIETPFWIWTSESPRRQPLFVAHRGAETLLSDRAGFEARLPLTADGDATSAVAALAELASRGVKIRTRALATTLFARVVLSDLFLHGIGGGKYDRVTDMIIARFFGLEPPDLMVLSATLRLPVDRPKTTLDDLRRVEAQQRELIYHPEQHLPPEAKQNEAVAAAIAEKERWVRTPQTVENARVRCRAIRAANEAMQAAVAAQRAELARAKQEIQADLRRSAILGSRSFAFCLYPEETLRRLMADFLPDQL